MTQHTEQSHLISKKSKMSAPQNIQKTKFTKRQYQLLSSNMN